MALLREFRMQNLKHWLNWPHFSSDHSDCQYVRVRRKHQYQQLYEMHFHLEDFSYCSSLAHFQTCLTDLPRKVCSVYLPILNFLGVGLLGEWLIYANSTLPFQNCCSSFCYHPDYCSQLAITFAGWGRNRREFWFQTANLCPSSSGAIFRA